MTSAFIVAARRSAIGRIGGLHRSRRLADLASPVVAAALADARLEPSQVAEVILGNATEGSNPARLVALSSGLPEHVPAMTVDRQCSSGLDAVLAAARLVATGEAPVVVAGGAESLSTAPWRLARPRSPFQVPHFVPLGQSGNAGEDGEGATDRFGGTDALAARLGISRTAQDAWVASSFARALAAREAGRFLAEIVPLRHNAEELKDQSAVEVDPEDFAEMMPFAPPHGTATPGNTASLHDGAAIAVVVSEKVWNDLGRPRALQLLAAATAALSPRDEVEAPIAAYKRLIERAGGPAAAAVEAIELNETSATQAIAFEKASGASPAALNADGGAIVRGHPLAASGAVLVARLFTRMARPAASLAATRGAAVVGTSGGMGVAALFEAIGG